MDRCYINRHMWHAYVKYNAFRKTRSENNFLAKLSRSLVSNTKWGKRLACLAGDPLTLMWK